MINDINYALEHSPDFMDGIEILFDRKPRNLAFLKAVEELNELAVKLLQQVNKAPNEVAGDDIIEEIVDVQMHLILLQQYFHYARVTSTTSEKIQKMIKSKDFNRYKQAPEHHTE